VLDNYLLSTDAISVSYSGTSIESESLKVLDQFTDLEIENLLPNRFIIPGLLEVENYDYMEGFDLEDTNDTGGGQNLGYTDSGDFADYLVYVPNTGNYGVKFRVAGFNEGQIGLYTVAEDNTEQELVIVNTKITNGWQTWETVAGNVFIEAGIHKLRMRVISPGFNLNWIAFDAPDSDGDGVFDNYDLCPDTPENTTVDVNGCEIFNLPSENFKTTINSETCRSQNNGSILIEALEYYNYSITLSGNDFFETKSFTDTIEFVGLSAGTYSACIQIPEKSDYEQCFTLVVREPQELEVSVELSEQNSKDELNASKKVSLNLAGGKVYFVKLNDKTIITQEDHVELELEPGINKLEVNTDNLCQGTYSEIINLAGLPNLSPNPIRDNQILVKLNDYYTDDIEVKIFELNGRLLLSKSFEIRGGELRIDAGALPKGIFLLQLNSGPRVYNLKFLK
jgi:hypothetical protein